ncbi:MAG: hypothetical protein IE909_08850 [Campylobacterales bacterium]|nr:hypothetical protein [Campylobacterales bacterium]
MPVDVINDIMSFGGKYEESGLGYSGECYLVGPDFKMRNNSRFTNDINDPVVKALGSTIGIWKVQTDSTKAVLQKGEASGKWVIDDYRGVSVLSVYGTIKIFDQVNWAIVAELDEEEALSDAVTLAQIVLIGSIICILITLVVFVMGINRVIVKPLHQFKDGLLEFFAYLNREKSDVQPLVVSSQDEIGLMSYVINQNIQTTKSNIEQDKKVILDTISVLQEFEQGDLCQRVKTSTSNPALQELTNLLNQMAEHLEENIDKVLNILEQYSQYNYLNKVKSEDLKAHLLKLANGVNGLGSSITSMLIDNKQNAVTLGESSTVLLKNVDTLSTNSNEAAVALEQTASALEQITGNITQTNESITKMESYAQGVTNSVQKGRDLATNTATSMDEINFQVNSINDAITVIDQIAFQTNILSLNAAVEAATAGEAGKGFAVVAGEVRNLATRSAEAANEIKKLVQSAREKANGGKEIVDQMIDGYNHLFESINHTIVLIKDVSVASNEQKAGIIQINDAINALDKQTQQNADIASQTKQIAVQTDAIAKVVYEETQKKQFENKQSDQRTQRINLEYTGIERRKLESNIKKSVLIEKPTNDMLHTKKPQEQKVAKVTPLKSNIPEDDEWASF